MNSTVLIASGFWLALPSSGSLMISILAKPGTRARLRQRPLASFGLACALGILATSLLVVALAENGLFDPILIGFAGWLIALSSCGVLAWRSSRRSSSPTKPRGIAWTGQLCLGFALLASAYLAWRYPAGSLVGIRDEGVYANTGIFLAQNGHLRIPYPWKATDEFIAGSLPYPGFYQAWAHREPQFAHLYPTWLALASMVGGIEAVLRLNGLFVLLSGLCFYLLVRIFTSEILAVGATLVLLFNPSQVWIARATLSEALAQLLTLTGLLLLVWALAARHAGLARGAGIAFGIVGLARLDGLLLAPILVAGCFAAHCLARERGDGHLAVWRALIQTLIPTCGLALLFYFAFTSHYLRDLYWPVVQIGLGTIAALYLTTVMIAPVRRWHRYWRNRRTAAIVATAICLLAGWAHWLRPPEIDPATNELQHATSTEASNERAWSLVNLGRYLTSAVLIFAVAGFAATVWKLQGRGRGLLLLPCAVVFGGFALLYLYDPIVDPKHFWAVRRFVPAVIPAFIFFAALGLHLLLRRFPPRARGTVALLCVVLTLAALWHRGRHYLFFAENPKIVEQLRDASARLPEDELILLPVEKPRWNIWATPLYVAFGHRIVPVSASARAGAASFDRWWRYEHARRRSVWILYTEERWPESWPAAEAVATFDFERQGMRATTRPLPTETFETSQQVVLYRSDPPPLENAAVVSREIPLSHGGSS